MKPDELPIDPDLDPADPSDPSTDKASATPRASVSRRARWDVIAMIALGGALGTSARAGLGQLFPAAPDRFPATTLVINLGGSFVLGALLVVLIDQFGSTLRLRPFLVTGVLGGFTTFSTFMVETIQLGQNGQEVTAVVYLVVSTLGGLTAAFTGIVVGNATVAALEHEPEPVGVQEIGDGS